MESIKKDFDFRLNLDGNNFYVNDEQILLKLKETFPEKISFNGDFRNRIPEILSWLRECEKSKKTIAFLVNITEFESFLRISMRDKEKNNECSTFLSPEKLELLNKYYECKHLFESIENKFSRKITRFYWVSNNWICIIHNSWKNIFKTFSKNSGLSRLESQNWQRFEIPTEDKTRLIQELNQYERNINSLHDEFAKQKELSLEIEVPSYIIIQFLIERIESLEKYIDTSSVKNIFKDNVEDAQKKWKQDIKWIIGILLVLCSVNLWVFITNHPFELKNIVNIIPLIVVEVILFKLLFFFFDRYSSYSKIEFLYNYYISLLEADKIYTRDESFTQEQNFVLREKTYSEITKLSANIVWLIDKKSIESVSDVVNVVKEISPFLKSVK